MYHAGRKLLEDEILQYSKNDSINTDNSSITGKQRYHKKRAYVSRFCPFHHLNHLTDP